MATSVEALGADLRTRTRQLRAKENARTKKCEVRFSIIRKSKIFQKKLREDWSEKVAKDGAQSCECVERPGSWNGAEERKNQFRFHSSWK